MLSDFWTPEQAAEYLHRSVNTLAQWRSRNTYPDLSYERYGHRVFYKPQVVKKWFKQHIQHRTSTLPEDYQRH